MVLYVITFAPLAEELCASAPDFLAPFYMNYSVFDGPGVRSDRLMTLFMEQRVGRGYFPEPAK